RKLPAAAQAARNAGALDLAAGWLRDHGDDQDIVRGAASLIAALQPDEAYLRNNILPLMDLKNSAELRSAASRLLGQPGNKWAVDPLLEILRQSAKQKDHAAWDAAQALGEIGDTRAIPTMIGVIAADNTYDT